MMDALLLSVIPILYLPSTIYATEQKKGSFRSFDNSGFPNGTIFLKENVDDISSGNWMSCGNLCIQTVNCKGFFVKENEFCKLTSTYQSGFITDSIGTQYYEKVRPCDYILNQCFSGTCTNVHDSYVCQCPVEAVIGDDCEQVKGKYTLMSDIQDAIYNVDLGICFPAKQHGLIGCQNGNEHMILLYKFQLNGVPARSSILSAKLKLTVKYSNYGFPYNIYIKAMTRADSISDVTQCNDIIHDHLRTTSQVTWSGPHSAKAVNDVIETPDISVVLNEVISMDGWQSGSHVDIIFYSDKNQGACNKGYAFYPNAEFSNNEAAPQLTVVAKL